MTKYPSLEHVDENTRTLEWMGIKLRDLPAEPAEKLFHQINRILSEHFQAEERLRKVLAALQVLNQEISRL